ncbi:unnamed protein product [Agarophyton chilense]
MHRNTAFTTASPLPCRVSSQSHQSKCALRVLRPRRCLRMSLAADVWNVNTVPQTNANGKKIALVGAGLAALITAMELVDAGCHVSLYDTRPFAGGKVGSWVDPDGNHIEMGLHVFFGCYYNLFDVMAKVGSFKHLLMKEHTHQFINKGGLVGELDFRMGTVGAPFNGLKAFGATSQLGFVDKVRNALALGSSVIVRGLVDFDGAMSDIRALDNISFSEWFLSKGGTRGSIQRLWDPIAYALGFINCDNMSARCMLTIFQLFAARSEASVLRMLEGSPDKFLTAPIVRYIEERGATLNLRTKVREVLYETDEKGHTRVTGLVVANGVENKVVQADYYVAACDVAGAKRLIPGEWRERYDQFKKLYELDAVPVVTVQVRFDGWVTELQDEQKRMRVGNGQAYGINNLLYSADADFSCFADLALTSPTDYYKEGEGSLMQVVLTPGDPYITKTDKEIVSAVLEQLQALFPSARDLKCTWSSVVKLAESLYREEPGKDLYRPTQRTVVDNFFLAGSYTYQDYIDSMEGAVKSGKLAAAAVLETVAAN